MVLKHISEILGELSLNLDSDILVAENLMDYYISKKGEIPHIWTYLDRARTYLESASIRGVDVNSQLIRLIDLERNSWD